MFGRFIFAFCAVFLWISSDEAVEQPLPTELSAVWVDALTVEVSWSRPTNLDQNCEHYEWTLGGGEFVRTSSTSFQQNLLTESSDWLVSVRTVCRHTWKSATASFTVAPPKPRGEVFDFRCYLSNSDMNCSWIPNLDFNHFSLSYRDCGTKSELINNFQTCDRIHEKGPRRECHLRGNFLQRDLCVVASTPNARSTFRAPKAFRPPEKMQISENGTSLILTLKPPQVEIPENSRYNICYSACDGHKTYVEFPVQRKTAEILIPYFKGCVFKIQHQTYTPDRTPIYSDWSDEVDYGWTDRSRTVVAIVIPVIVSLSVLVSCVCFRRHKDIIFPDVPDPSSIVKEMMNSNRDNRPRALTYE